MNVKKILDICPVCRAALVTHTRKDVTVLWCSKNPLHFRWEMER